MQRCGRLLSELFVQLIFVCKPGGGYNCSHVALYEDIASLVSPGPPRSGFGRSLAHSKGEREIESRRRWGRRKRELLVSGVCACSWRWREKAASHARFSPSTSRQVTNTARARDATRLERRRALAEWTDCCGVFPRRDVWTCTHRFWSRNCSPKPVWTIWSQQLRIYDIYHIR